MAEEAAVESPRVGMSLGRCVNSEETAALRVSGPGLQRSKQVENAAFRKGFAVSSDEKGSPSMADVSPSQLIYRKDHSGCFVENKQ